MTDQNELKYYIEDLQRENITALLSVRLSEFSGVTLTGDIPSHVATITCNPQEGWTKENREIIDIALQNIASVLRNRFGVNNDPYEKSISSD